MSKLITDNRLFIRRVFLVIIDLVMVGAASIAALLLRFNLTFDSIQGDYLENMLSYLPFQMVVSIAVFFLFRLYSSIWVFASLNELENVVIASVISSALYYVGLQILSPWTMPRSFYLLYMMCIMAFVGAT